MAGNAIEQFLMQRAMQERQAQMDAMAEQQQQEQQRRQAEELRLRQQQESRIAQTQQAEAARAQSQQSNEFGVRTMMADAMNQGPLTPDLAKQIGIMGVREGVPVPGMVSQAMTPPKQPEPFTLNPGDVRYGGDGQVIARGDPKPIDPALAESRELRNEFDRQRIEQAQAKIEDEKKWREKTGEDAKRVTQTAYDLASRLKTHPGLAKAQGVVSSRLTGWTQDAEDFKGIRDQLIAALALPNLGALKGPMSDKDVIFIKDLSTRLRNERLSDDEARLAVDEAMRFLESKGATSSTGSAETPEQRAKRLYDKYAK
jgi:hypothetical protein